MTKPTVSQVLKMRKSELEKLLADDRCRKYPSPYAGHEDDAIAFVRNCLGTTRKDLLLSISVFGLAMADNGGIPHPGHDLDRWVIRSEVRLAPEKLAALGVAPDATYHSGYVHNGQQHWIYTAIRPLSVGVACPTCDAAKGAA